MAEDIEVEAAGGLLGRHGDDGIEVLLVHRPKYDDWSFPKGKLDEGETAAEAALREVAEETGFRCELGEEVGTVRYTDRHGRSKRVRYWAMDVLDGAFSPNDEVDRVEWHRLDRARGRLTYAHDRDLLDGVASRVWS